MREQALYSDLHILNRTEAWDRLNYWINDTTGNEAYNLSVISILVSLLRKDEEERATKPEDEEAKRILKVERLNFEERQDESEPSPFEDPDTLKLEDEDYYQDL